MKRPRIELNPVKSRRDGGMTLVEIIISLGIMAIALVGLVSVIVHTSRHNAMMRENLIAMRAAEQQLELMQNTPFDNIYTTFSGSGRFFAVTGLRAMPATPQVGEIKFPGFQLNQLREDMSGALMSPTNTPLPNIDMNANGNPNESTNFAIGPVSYGVLPLMIELRWQGIQGDRTLAYRHMILKK